MRLIAILTLLIFRAGLLCAQPQMRPLTELINTQDPGWKLVQTWIKTAKNSVRVLPEIAVKADSALLAAQVTTRSPMGAIIYETGGILIDNGWLRILGSGSAGLNRDLMGWNKGKQQGLLLVADDVLGGFFAINGGALGQASTGKIYYLAPDTLEWEPLDFGYSDFLIFCFSSNLGKFYNDLRWKGWEQDLAKISGDQALLCLPPLFTKEGKKPNKVSRNPVPIAELWGLHNDFRQQLGIH